MTPHREAFDLKQVLSRRRFLLVLLAAHFGVRALARGERATPEYAVKASFLFHLGAFVEWPGTAFATPHAPFLIGILGDDPFGRVLEQMAQTERLGEHPFQIVRWIRGQDIRTCQILFIAASEAPRISQILRAVQDRPVLSVSDMADFASRGGMIQMDTSSGHVRLQVNLASAKASGLSVSSKLLRLAEQVET